METYQTGTIKIRFFNGLENEYKQNFSEKSIFQRFLKHFNYFFHIISTKKKNK